MKNALNGLTIIMMFSLIVPAMARLFDDDIIYIDGVIVVFAWLLFGGLVVSLYDFIVGKFK
tara:strand:+ start:204 stop:386 length:183 start_codon:yes stop_codon:yes gene_type:complete